MTRRPIQRPSKQNRERTTSSCGAPSSGQDVSFAGLQTEPKAAVLSYCQGFVYPADRFIGSQRCEGPRSHNFCPGEMAKHKPCKFACSTLRLERSSSYENATQKIAEPSKKGKLTEAKTLKARTNTANYIEPLIGRKQKHALQRMKTKHGNTPAQSRPVMRRSHFRVLLAPLFVALRATQKHRFPVPVRLLFIE